MTWILFPIRLQICLRFIWNRCPIFLENRGRIPILISIYNLMFYKHQLRWIFIFYSARAELYMHCLVTAFCQFISSVFWLRIIIFNDNVLHIFVNTNIGEQPQAQWPIPREQIALRLRSVYGLVYGSVYGLVTTNFREKREIIELSLKENGLRSEIIDRRCKEIESSIGIIEFERKLLSCERKLLSWLMKKNDREVKLRHDEGKLWTCDLKLKHLHEKIRGLF